MLRSSVSVGAAVIFGLSLAGCPGVALHRPLSIDFEPPLEDPPPHYEDGPRLALDRPRDGDRVSSPVALVEIVGRLERVNQKGHDVVIVIDTSGSAFLPSGADIDGDGEVGQSITVTNSLGREFVVGCTDPGDMVVEAERIAAIELIGLLDPRRSRAALVKFGTYPWVEVWLSEPSRARQSVEQFRYKRRGGTDIYRAVERALDVLDAPKERAGMRSILILSDGVMTIRLDRETKEYYRRRVLRRSRENGVRIHTFGIGPVAVKNPRTLRDLAEQTGGNYTPVEAAEAIRVELPMVDLTGLSDIEIVNVGTGMPGRAIRLFPDGTFDGYAPLVDGWNELVVRAALVGGGIVEAQLNVEYVRPAADARSDQRALDQLLKRLRERTTETDLARRAQTTRRARRLRSLEIELEERTP